LSGTHILSNTARSGGGLYAASSGVLTATNGCVVNNSDASADGASIGSGALVATDNWWGAANGPGGAGPGGGDSVSAGVDFSGFKTAAPPGCPTLRADLLIHKAVTTTGSGQATVVVPGQAITYTLTFTNAGPHIARHVVVGDRIPVSVTVNSVVSSGMNITQSAAGRLYTWHVIGWGVPKGSSGIITISGVLSNPLSASSFTNTAVITTATTEVITTNNRAEASLTVREENTAPVGVDDIYTASYEIPLKVSAVAGVLSNDQDIEGDPLTAGLAAGPADGSLVLNLDGSFVYTPTDGFSSDDVFTYIVSDGTLTDTADVTITVETPDNTPPTISDIVDRHMLVNTMLGPIPFTIEDAETAPDNLVLSKASSDPTLVPPANIVLGGSGTDRSVTIMPTAGQTGTAAITITVSDSELMAHDTFVLTVEPFRYYLPLLLKNAQGKDCGLGSNSFHLARPAAP
jgi:uncharacterized repeat protein (TIGR01451 family)